MNLKKAKKQHTFSSLQGLEKFEKIPQKIMTFISTLTVLQFLESFLQCGMHPLEDIAEATETCIPSFNDDQAYILQFVVSATRSK